MQANSAVAESRVVYRVRSIVTAPNGITLAVREGDVRLRTFDSPPYAVLAGALDDSLAARANGVGDDGGGASTLVTVELLPLGVASASPIPANVWSERDEHAATVTPAWEP